MPKRKTFTLNGINGQLSVSDNASIYANPTKGKVGVNVQGIKPTKDVTLGVNVGADPLKGKVGVTPTVQVGNSAQAKTGAQIGGTAGAIAGTAIGGPVGTAVGSTVGSAIGSSTGQAFKENPTGAAIGTALGGLGVGSTIGAKVIPNFTGGDKSHKKRNSLRGKLFGSGLYLADGSEANINLDAQDGTHSWKYGDKRVDNVGDRHLYAYETDYTNDLDYLSSMGGISLARLVAGDKNKEVDQVGQALGNQALGKAGYGAQFNKENFSHVVDNLRSFYAQKGISNKQEMTALINKAYADGRIEDADVGAMNQTANIIFDGNFDLASQLMSNRWAGIQTASKQKSSAGEPDIATMRGKNNYSHYKYSPVISYEEALASVNPLIDLYKQNKKQAYDERKDKTAAGASNIATGLGIASGVYNLANRVTGGAVSSTLADLFKGAGKGISGVASEIGDALGLTSSASEADSATIGDAINSALSGAGNPAGLDPTDAGSFDPSTDTFDVGAF